MAESNQQDRNLPASPRKLEKAREDGQVARSRDLGHFVAIAAGGALLVALAPLLAGWLQQTLKQGLRFDRSAVASPTFMGERLLELSYGFMAVVLPMGGAMVLAALAGGVATGGWNWTLKPLAPKFDKLNPITGLPKIVSKDKLVDAIKGSALALILGTIGAFYLKGHIEAFGGVLAMPLPAAISHAAGTLLSGLVYLVMALALFALIDVPLQRHMHAQRLKMSH